MLATSARGADVVGQDISAPACEFVRKRLGLQVYEVPFETCAELVGTVDAVVMIDLIEHLSDPRAALETAWGMLAPRGLLLLWTPNGGAAGASATTARSWVGFRVDLDHLQYFSPGTVMSLCRLHRWRVEHLETLGFPEIQRGATASRPGLATARSAVRYYASRVPGARRLARGLGALVREVSAAGLPDARAGTYHLLAILRKA